MAEVYCTDDNSVFSHTSYGPHIGSEILAPYEISESFIHVNPIEVTSRTSDGFVLGDFLEEEIYGKVHISKTNVVYSDLGSETTLEVEIWNPRDEDAVISNLSVSQDLIVTLADNDVVERNWYRLFNVVIPKDGGIEFEYLVSFTVDDLDLTLRISGSRAFVFPFRPNWANGVIHSYEFLTEVVKSRSGKSHRRSFRKYPRRSIGFSSWVAGEKRAEFKEKIDKYVGRNMIVPDWAKPMRLTSAAPVGSNFLACDTEFSEIVPGSVVLVFTSEFNYEINYVTEVAPSGLTLQNPLALEWNYGTVYEGFRCQIDSFSAMRHLTEDLTEFEVTGRFYKSSYPDSENYDTNTLEEEANWTNPPEMTVGPVIDKLDDSVTEVVRSPYSNQNVKEVSFKVTNFGKQKIYEFEAMLRARLGRYSRFVSRLTDLPLKPLIDSNRLEKWGDIRDQSVVERINRGDKLFLLLKEGEYKYLHSITSAEKREKSVERVFIFSDNNVLETAEGYYLCETCSFSSDSFQLTYLTPEIMECDVSLETYSKDTLND